MKSRLAQPSIFCIAAVLSLSPMIALADPPPATGGEELEPLPPPTSAPAPPLAPQNLIDPFGEASNDPADTPPAPPQSPRKTNESWNTNTAPPSDPTPAPSGKQMRSPDAFGYGIVTVIVSSVVVGVCIAGLAGATADSEKNKGKYSLFLALGLLGGGIGSIMIYYGGQDVNRRFTRWYRPEPILFIGEDRTQLGLVGRF